MAKSLSMSSNKQVKLFSSWIQVVSFVSMYPDKQWLWESFQYCSEIVEHLQNLSRKPPLKGYRFHRRADKMPFNFSANFAEKEHFYLCSLLTQQEPTNAQVTLPISSAILVNCVIASALVPPAVLGNSLILAVIYRTPALTTPPYVLLAGLAFTDLCTGLIIHPLYITYMMSDLNNNQTLLCLTGVLISILGAYFLFISFGTMTLMSVERWLLMKHRTFFTIRRVCVFFTILLCAPIPVTILYLWPSSTLQQLNKLRGVQGFYLQ